MQNIIQPVSFDLISDLHLHLREGWSPDYAKIRKNDLLIVAGDVHRNPEATAAEIGKMSNAWKTVLFIDGNNERRDPGMTDGDFNLGHVHDRLRLATADMKNVLYLRDGNYISNGVAIIGRNGEWDHKAAPGYTQEQGLADQAQMFYDFMNQSPAAGAEARDQMSRHGGLANMRLMRLSMEEALDAARGVVEQGHKDYTELREQVVLLNADPSIHTIVVVTHTVPHMGKLLSFPADTSQWRMSTMANTEMDKLKDHDTNGKLKYWLFGHQIERKNEVVNGITCIANPLGGPRDALYLSPDDYRPFSAEISPSAAPAPVSGGALPRPAPK